MLSLRAKDRLQGGTGISCLAEASSRRRMPASASDNPACRHGAVLSLCALAVFVAPKRSEPDPSFALDSAEILTCFDLFGLILTCFEKINDLLCQMTNPRRFKPI